MDGLNWIWSSDALFWREIGLIAWKAILRKVIFIWEMGFATVQGTDRALLVVSSCRFQNEWLETKLWKPKWWGYDVIYYIICPSTDCLCRAVGTVYILQKIYFCIMTEPLLHKHIVTRKITLFITILCARNVPLWQRGLHVYVQGILLDIFSNITSSGLYLYLVNVFQEFFFLFSTNNEHHQP